MEQEKLRSTLQDITGQMQYSGPAADAKIAMIFGELIAEEEKQAVSAPNRKAQELENEINLAGAGGSLSGFQRTQQWQHYNNDIRRRNGGKADTTVSDLAILQGQLVTLNIEIAQIKSRMAELKTDISANEERLDELYDRIEGTQTALDEDYARGGYHLTENGELENTQAEAALQAYETRTGKSVKRDNPDDVTAALEEQIKHDRQEAKRLETENAEKNREHDEQKRQLDIKESEREVKEAEVQNAKIASGISGEERLEHSAVTKKQISNDAAMFENAFGTALNNVENIPEIKAAFSAQANGEVVEATAEPSRLDNAPKPEEIQPI